MRQRIASLLVALFCGCAAVTASPVSDVLTPRELNTHPEQYDGLEVVVRGFVILGTNGRCLYQSKERHEQFERALYAKTPGNLSEFDGDCLTMINAHVLEENRSIFNRQTITVRGHFVRNYRTKDMLDLQACNESTALALDGRDTLRLLRALRAAAHAN